MHKVNDILLLHNLENKSFEKFNFCCALNVVKEHERLVVFKNASARAKSYVFWMSLKYVCFTSMHVTVDDITFYGVLECLYKKP